MNKFSTLITIKLTSAILICILMILSACGRKGTKVKSVDTHNSDTTYFSSTRVLKSDKIPDSVFSTTNLRHLSISGMDCDVRESRNVTCWMIKELPPEIKNLKNLTTLTLTLTAMQTIPIELAELKKLKVLVLTDNSGLSDIGFLTKIQSLEFLYLYGCGLTKLPHNIGDLKNLKELGLVGNPLDKAEQERIKKALPSCMIKF